MAVPKQTGTEVEVGFQGMSWSGYMPEDGFSAVRDYGDREVLSDGSGATRTKIRTDERTTWSGELVVDAGNDFIISEGDIISLSVPNNAGTGTALLAEVQEAPQATFNRKSVRLQITLLKEVSMTYATTTTTTTTTGA